MGRRAGDGEQTVATNRKARHDYAILERFETGIVLTGDGVKSLRGGRASLAEAFARVREGEVWLAGMDIRVYFSHGLAKVELALARGKRRHEKRQAIAKREHEREMQRALGRRR